MHFNEKLLRSAPLRNPRLLDKLTAYVDFGPADQHATNLPPALWDPAGFPPHAFADALAASQARVADARERARLEQAREKVEFVGSVLEPPQRAGESAAERVMKGLDRDKRGAGSSQQGGRRADEGRGGRRDDRDRKRDDDYRDRRRDDDRERERKRRRSRSRSVDRRDRRRDVESRDRR